MFTELNSILSISPDKTPQGEFIVVSERQCDASFLIHHFLSFYLRAGCKVLFLGLLQSFSHYCSVAQRLGVSLAQAKVKGQLVFLEGLHESVAHLVPGGGATGSHALDFLRDPRKGLRSLFEFVQDGCGGGSEGSGGDVEAEGGWGPPVLLVDDLSVLLSLGLSSAAVLDFSHYLRATVCSRLQGNVVTLLRCEDEEDEAEEAEPGAELLLRGLTHQSTLTLHVQGLPTGFCRDIHGQMEVCWRRPEGQNPQKKLFQFKVQDKGASFFARGTSSAVL